MRKISQFDQTEILKPRPLLYILNNLEVKEFSVDLWELFGSEDNFKKALVGKWDATKGDFKSITWDWSASNIKHIINILYFLNKLQRREIYIQKDFDNFYDSNIKHSEDVVEALSRIGLGRPIYALYVIRYKKQFSALIIELEKISWKKYQKRQLLITFKPTHYFVMDPDSWLNVKKDSKDIKEWSRAYQMDKPTLQSFTEIFLRYSSIKQYIYGLVPLSVLYKSLRSSQVLFIKPVQRVKNAKIVSDNLIFWELFYYFTGATRVNYDIAIEVDHLRYAIRRIPIDALNEKSNVYRHEAGVANVISHVLIETFGDAYLKAEFNGKNEITYRDSNILKREYPVRNIPGEEQSEYQDADYDYALNLTPLGIDKLILTDLTTALWRKGLLDYEEYTRKWREVCFRIPSEHNNVTLIWYILINDIEKKFFTSPPPNKIHSNFDAMLNDLSSGTDKKLIKVITDESGVESYMCERIVVLPIFKKSSVAKNVEKELANLLDDYQNTLFYKAFLSILQQLIKS